MARLRLQVTGHGCGGYALDGPPGASNTCSNGSSGPSGPVSARFRPWRDGPARPPGRPWSTMQTFACFLRAVGPPGAASLLVTLWIGATRTCVQTCAQPCLSGPGAPGYSLAVGNARTDPSSTSSSRQQWPDQPPRHPRGLCQSILRAPAVGRTEAPQRPLRGPQTRLGPFPSQVHRPGAQKGPEWRSGLSGGGPYSYKARATPVDRARAS